MAELPTQPRVKVCGLRRIDDARLAVECGAFALGLIFHRPSPRFIEPADAAELVRGLRSTSASTPPVAGVFVDWELDDLRRVVDEVGLDVVQLHGRESPNYAAELTGVEVWKALRVGPDFDPSRLADYPPPVRILLDTYRKGREGGTGEVFDWDVARRCQEERPIILAGGIRPENAADAVRVVRPWALDASSGVESAPGVKDAARLRALFDAVCAAS